MNLYERDDHIVKRYGKRNLNCLDERATGVDDLEHPGQQENRVKSENEVPAKQCSPRVSMGKRLLQRL
jgi:hypothetical protein